MEQGEARESGPHWSGRPRSKSFRGLDTGDGRGEGGIVLKTQVLNEKRYDEAFQEGNRAEPGPAQEETVRQRWRVERWRG